MKGVDTIARVRREFYVRGRSIKEIARELHVSRNTVRKILRSGATAFEYERSVHPPLRHRRDRQRELALQKPRLSISAPPEHGPARLRHPHRCVGPGHAPHPNRGSKLDADPGAV